jgi:hypothetical protein
MSSEAVISRITSIFGARNVDVVEPVEDASGLLVRVGSALIAVRSREGGDGAVVLLTATVLEDVDGSGEARQRVLEAVNERNRSATLGRFSFDPDRRAVVVDHVFLADRWAEDELMKALEQLAREADDADDRLREAIGSGVRAIDARPAE